MKRRMRRNLNLKGIILSGSIMLIWVIKRISIRILSFSITLILSSLTTAI